MKKIDAKEGKKVLAAVLIAAAAGTLVMGCTSKQKSDVQGEGTSTEMDSGEGKNEANQEKEDMAGQKESDISDQPEGINEEDGEIQKEYTMIVSSEKVKDYGNLVVVGDAAYELFSYQKETAAQYADAVNAIAKELKGTAQVYDMIIPLGSGIIFPDNLLDEINSTDQEKAMDKIYALMDESVKKVDIYDSLMSHRDEYIYFRTDHHWTALGAYYAYDKLCEVRGLEPAALDSFETKDFEGFVGSFYKDTEDGSLKAKPDTIHAYLPKSNAVLHVTASDGTNYEWKVIYDVSSYGESLKYSTFVAGDNPMTVIENKDISDGSSCAVVKESFGNALIPFLVDHYQTIYVIDYRYWTGNLASFVKKNEIPDVYLLNNLSMVRNKYLVGQFSGIAGEN